MVLVTAEETTQNVQRASQYDILDFISKPFDSPVVLEKVGKIFGVEDDPQTVKAEEDLGFLWRTTTRLALSPAVQF